MCQEQHYSRIVASVTIAIDDAQGLKRGKGRHSHIVLVPQPSDDPRDPLNWPRWKKEACFWTLAFAASLDGALSPMTGPGYVLLSQQFGISVDAVASAFGLAQNALAAKFGHRIVYLLSVSLMFISCIWCALSPNIASIRASRVFQGFGMSSLQSLVPCTIEQIYFVHERGSRNVIWSFAVLAGIVLYVVQNISWQMGFWFVTIPLGIAVLLIFFFVPETTYHREAPRVLQGQAVNGGLLHEKPHDSVEEHSSSEEFVQTPALGVSYLEQLKIWHGVFTPVSLPKLFLRPLPFLLSPVFWFVFLAYGMQTVWLSLMPICSSTIFTIEYNFTASQIGLTNLGGLVGIVLATVISGPLTDWGTVWLSKHNRGIYEPEFRLSFVLAMLFGVFGMANFSMVMTGSAMITYLLDTHGPNALHILAVVNFLKNMVLYGFTFFANGMIARLGVKTSLLILAGCQAFCWISSIPMYIFGKRARLRGTLLFLRLEKKALVAQSQGIEFEYIILDIEAVNVPAQELDNAATQAHVPGTALLTDRGVSRGKEIAIDDARGLKRGKGRHSHVILVPQPSDDPRDPLNWPRWKKEACFWTLAFAASLDGALSPMTGPGYVLLSQQFGISVDAVASAFGLAQNALAAKFGHRIVYLLSVSLMFISCIWCALSPNIASIRASRAFQGFGMSALQSLVASTIEQIYFVHERGSRNVIWHFAILAGITLYVIQNISWQMGFWFVTIPLGIAVLLIFFFVPETTYHREAPRVLQGQAVNGGGLLHEKPHDSVEEHSSSEEFVQTPALGVSYLEQLKIWHGVFTPVSLPKLFLRPLPFLLSPVLWFVFLGYGMQTVWLSLMPICSSTIFTIEYNFTASQIGLTNLGGLVGIVLATVISGPLTDWGTVWLSKHNRGIYEPEFRLFFALAMLFGIFGMANFSMVMTGSAVITYLLDTHGPNALHILAVVNFLKNMVLYGFTFFANGMIARLGVKTSLLILAGCQAFCWISSIPMYIFGKRVRSFIARYPAIFTIGEGTSGTKPRDRD
ncbi:hypothetical protein NP233_g1218 [Leucocoprinus birnbaumii]|uniref:Major facilitator superfamily (MFS) profile domain-containing protein n=1 Tax=Leucocoprinus birnbaumii TaxID=56174 RepID=A0AAD5YW16_9AGAR|nr:hypothetical protein NP233_g1218 [Leucocoprinus birnbaumii]